MDFNNVMAIWQARIDESTEQTTPAASDDPLETMPGNMPLTNRLDKMTRYQAIWAIENGDAWIAYLQEQSEAGQDVSVIEYGEQPVQNGNAVTDADTYKAICGGCGSTFGKG